MASPPPHKELARLEQRLRTRELPAVLVISGTSEWFRGRAVDLALAAVPEDADRAIVEGLSIDARGVRAEADAEDDERDGDGDAGTDDGPAANCPHLEPLRGGGLFCSRAFVVVRRGDKWLKRYGPALQSFLPRIPRGSGLILEVVKLDKRTRLAKELGERGETFEFRDLYETPFGRPDSPLEGELVQWVLAHARALGAALTPESALLLTAQVGKDPADLAAELQRLADQLGSDPKRAPLAPKDLAGRLTTGFESTPFELAEAVLGNDRVRAFRSLRAIFQRGVKGRDGKAMDQGGLFPFATSWLFQTIGQVLEGRLLLDEGTSLRDVPGRVGVRFFAERYAAQVRDNDADQLRAALRMLLHLQRLKRSTAEEDEVLLERFVVQWFDGGAVPSPLEMAW